MGCFFLIALTLITRVCLKLFAIVIKNLRISYLNTHNGQDPPWYKDHRDAFVCESIVASYVPTGLFTLAIMVNATRWMHLIKINKEQQRFKK
jgi:hypothetical protein